MKKIYSQNINFYINTIIIFSLFYIILPTQANAETQECSSIEEHLCPCEQKQRDGSVVNGQCLCPAGVSVQCNNGTRRHIYKSNPLESLKLTIQPGRKGKEKEPISITLEDPPGNIEQYLGNIYENPWVQEQLKEKGVGWRLRRALRKGRAEIKIDSVSLNSTTRIYNDPLGTQDMKTLQQPRNNARAKTVVWGDINKNEFYSDCFFKEPALTIEYPCQSQQKGKLCFGYVQCSTDDGSSSLSSPAFPVSCPLLQNNNCPSAMDCVLLNKEKDSSFQIPTPFQVFGELSSIREQVQLLGDIHSWIEGFNNNIVKIQKLSKDSDKKDQLAAMKTGINKLIEDNTAKIDETTDPQIQSIYQEYNQLAQQMLAQVTNGESSPAEIPSTSPIESQTFEKTFSDNYMKMIQSLPQSSEVMENLKNSLSRENFDYQKVFSTLNTYTIEQETNLDADIKNRLDNFLQYMPGEEPAGPSSSTDSDSNSTTPTISFTVSSPSSLISLNFLQQHKISFTQRAGVSIARKQQALEETINARSINDKVVV